VFVNNFSINLRAPFWYVAASSQIF